MEFESVDQIEIVPGRRDEEAYKMEDFGESLLHYSEAELSASRINMKERRLLSRSWAKLEADRTYRMRCMQTDLRLAELRQTRLETRSARVRSHLAPEERASMRRLDAAGKLRLPSGSSYYRRPAHLEPSQLIVSTQRRLNAGGRRCWTAQVTSDSSRNRSHHQQLPLKIDSAVRFRDLARNDGYSSSSDSEESDSSTSTTESLRKLRIAAAASRRPLTAVAAEASSRRVSGDVSTRQQQSQQHQRSLLTSQSCQPSFFTGDTQMQQRLGQKRQIGAVPGHRGDKQLWAEAERQKLRDLDRPVRDFLRSLAEMRV